VVNPFLAEQDVSHIEDALESDIPIRILPPIAYPEGQLYGWQKQETFVIVRTERHNVSLSSFLWRKTYAQHDRQMGLNRGIRSFVESV